MPQYWYNFFGKLQPLRLSTCKTIICCTKFCTGATSLAIHQAKLPKNSVSTPWSNRPIYCVTFGDTWKMKSDRNDKWIGWTLFRPNISLFRCRKMARNDLKSYITLNLERKKNIRLVFATNPVIFFLYMRHKMVGVLGYVLFSTIMVCQNRCIKTLVKTC